MIEKAHPQKPPMASKYKNMANAIRFLSMDAVQKANSGHPGMPMGMADVATVLFSEHLKFNPQDPDWPDRDRFILSAGHGSMLLYSLLHLTGYEEIDIEQLKHFRQLGSKTAGHPEYGYAKGIETTTGPLGQGVANSVGFALAEQMMQARFPEITDHYTYVLAGDGCLMEGISHEAISLAGHLKLAKLIILFDDNNISIDGSTDLSVSDDQIKRFEASNWHTQTIDGHNFEEIHNAIKLAKESNKPSLIACKTTIAFGAPTKAGTSAAHGAPLGEEEIEETRKKLGWSYPPFEIPENIRNDWKEAGIRNNTIYKSWQNALKNLDINKKNEFERLTQGNLPENLDSIIKEAKQTLFEKAPKWATRKASGQALETLAPHIPELIGGSADLTGSNLTKASCQNPITAKDFSGSYVYYGVREHAMAAAMNGFALHGGFIPYGGTFLVFTDYCKPAIRLSALMGLRVIYVMTHDSIGLGEDGPTHQPIEHLSALRAIPNTYVFRPADAVETLECWEIALKTKESPSILSLTRQGVTTIRTENSNDNKCKKGAYVLSTEKEKLQVTLIATGSEVVIALKAQTLLQKEGIGTRVVSMPCMELFDEQPTSYKEATIPDNSLCVGIEAACKTGWEKYIGKESLFIGMSGFGESAPATDLYEHFNITAEETVKQVKSKL